MGGNPWTWGYRPHARASAGGSPGASLDTIHARAASNAIAAQLTSSLGSTWHGSSASSAGSVAGEPSAGQPSVPGVRYQPREWRSIRSASATAPSRGAHRRDRELGAEAALHHVVRAEHAVATALLARHDERRGVAGVREPDEPERRCAQRDPFARDLAPGPPGIERRERGERRHAGPGRREKRVLVERLVVDLCDGRGGHAAPRGRHAAPCDAREHDERRPRARGVSVHRAPGPRRRRGPGR
jgi:hypothetical protein